MMSKKIKVLLAPSDPYGVGHYRSIWPGLALDKYYNEDFEVEINEHVNTSDIDYLKKFDIIHFHRQLGSFEETHRVIPILRASGVICILDIDDYWEPSTSHPLYSMVKEQKLDEKILSVFPLADYITTTTEIFARHLREHNKNVFVMPNSLDMDKPMWSSDVMENPTEKCRIAWIGGSCYDDQTEVLTDSGFKLFKDLEPEDKVATLDPNTGETIFEAPKGYIREDYVGDLICADTDLINFAVTPNHNMYASLPESLTQKKVDFKLVQAVDIFGKDIHLDKKLIFKGENVEYFILKGIESRKRELTEDMYIPMGLWVKFFGFWLAEGWTSKTKGLNQVGVCQIKDNNHLEEMYTILCEMGFKPTYTKDGNQIRVFDKRLWTYLSEFGYSYDKFIPREIKNLSTELLSDLLKYFLFGDGSKDKDRWRAYTSSKKLASDINEIAVKIGLLSSVKNRGIKEGEQILFDGRKIQAKHEAFVVSIGSNGIRNRQKPLLRKEKIFKRYYDGVIYCVNVSTNIIYVRRDGKSMWCGNSHMSDLKLLEPSITRLYSNKELEDKFQFVLCGFDTRGKISEQMPDGSIRQRTMRPEETVWLKFEDIFTNKSCEKNKDPEYFQWLSKLKKEEYPGQYEKNYVRRWTLPLTQYGYHYNYCDVCLAPLVETDVHRSQKGQITTRPHLFNEVKSELKIIEAGMKKKVLIAQDFGIYKELLEHGKTALLVSDNKDGWYKAMRDVVNSKDLREELTNNLHEFVKDKYDIKTVTNTRADFYKSLIIERDKKQIVEVTAVLE